MTELELLSYKNRSHISSLADNCFLIFDFCQGPTASANAFADINSAGYAVYFKQSRRSIAQLQNPYQRVRGSRRAADGRCRLLGRGRGLLGPGAGAGSVSRAKIFGWGDSEGEAEAAGGVRVPAAAIARPEAGAVGEGETAAV